MASAAADERPVVFRGVTVIDGTGAGPRRQVDVVLAASRIVEVGLTIHAPKNGRAINAPRHDQNRLTRTHG
jgi:hypothetical protein